MVSSPRACTGSSNKPSAPGLTRRCPPLLSAAARKRFPMWAHVGTNLANQRVRIQGPYMVAGCSWSTSFTILSTEKCPFKFTQRPFMWKPGFWSAGNLQAAICVPHVKPRRRASNWLRKFIKYYITFPFGLFPLKKDIPIAQNHALYSPCFSLPPSSLLLSNIWTYLDPQIFPREWQTMKEFTPLFDASNWFHKVCSWPASHARVTNKITKWMTCNHHVITCNQHKKL